MQRYLILLACTLVSYPLGLALGQAWLLPLLNAAPAYVLMVRALRAGRRGQAVGLMLTWAVLLAVVGTSTFVLWPSDPGPLVWHGAEYREEMFHWIRTGEGSEGNPALFLPEHLLHLGVFVVLCLVVASSLSIFMGAVLMNYMAYYVASLARAGAPTWAVIALGWQPWAICRVGAFCVLGAVLAEPLLARVRPYAYGGLGSARPYLLGAACGILADGLLKWLLAPTWEGLLRVSLP